MNRYDQLMRLILNRILLCFGMRLIDDDRIVFMYRIQNYDNPNRTNSLHVIQLSKDVSKAFEFLKMDYNDYKQQQFDNIFEFTAYVTENCKYITRQFIESLEKEIAVADKTYFNQRPEVFESADRFVKTVKVGHIVLRDFDFVPIIMYLNLRESIIRNFFKEAEVKEQFVTAKLLYQKDTELLNKFSPEKLVKWISPLKEKPVLAGLFSRSYVEYVTEGFPEKFPRYVIDNDVNIIKKEVLTYYYYIFLNTQQYRIYCLEDADGDKVKI